MCQLINICELFKLAHSIIGADMAGNDYELGNRKWKAKKTTKNKEQVDRFEKFIEL